MDNTDRGNKPDQADGDPRPAAVTFVTTEHFTLQGARSSTISESTGRASVFLGAVSGGLIALGLVATATKTGVAFYAFGLILLPTLAFVGLATFHRVLQSGIEDLGYARRIAQLRDYYFDHAPEVAGYLPSPAERNPRGRTAPREPTAGRTVPRRAVDGLPTRRMGVRADKPGEDEVAVGGEVAVRIAGPPPVDGRSRRTGATIAATASAAASRASSIQQLRPPRRGPQGK